jgi:iron complex outermembrane receptor protein
MTGFRSHASAWTLLFCQTLLLSGACIATAQAQETVETVVVTAEKRAQNEQDVPISMTALSSGDLTRFHTNNIHDLITQTPNLNLVTQGVNDVIYVRGFGSSPNNFAFDPDVAVYDDGIYAGRSGQFIEPMFDVDHVEVLRGPQGALLGKNTAAGAISITSAQPSDTFHASATASYDFIMTGPQVYGYVTGPIADGLTARLAVKIVNQDGWLHNLATNKKDPHIEQELVRGVVKYAPTTNFDISVKLEYGNFVQTGGINTDGSLTERPPRVDTRYVREPYGPSGLTETNGVDSTNVAATANYHMGDYTLTSITGYSFFHRYPLNGYDETNPTGGPTTPGVNNLFQNGFPERFDQESEEVRFLSPTGQTVEYVVGGYWDQANWNVRQNIFYNIGAFHGAQYTNFNQVSTTYSVFALATWHVEDDFRVLGSARYTSNDKTAFFTSGTYYGNPMRAITSVNGHRSEGSFDPSIALQYDARQNLMFYASAARGSKSGGFVSNTFGVTAVNFTFKPERSMNYEVGMKSMFYDGHLLFNADIYDLNIKNLQVSSYVPALSSFITDNAGSATSRGAEFEVQWLPIDALQLSLSGAYLDAKYDHFLGAACLASDPVSVCNPASPASIAQHSLAGQVLEYSSKWTGNAQAHYTTDVGGGYLLEGDVMASLRTRFFNADNYSQIYGIQPTVVKWDARLQLDQSDEGWDVAIAGRNLTNQKTISNTLSLPGSVTTQARTISYNDPTRSVWIEASYHF